MAAKTGTFIEVERRGETAIVALHGRLTEMEAGRIEQELVLRIEDGANQIVLDLADVPLITSAGLGAFMVAHRECRARGGAVRIANPQPLVRQVLQTTKLTKLFATFESVDAALRAGGNGKTDKG